MLTQSDLERRRLFLTATDIPAIIGVNHFKNAHDVYLEKTQSFRPWDGNDATEGGNLLEPAILQWASKKLGPINPGDWRVHENGILAATLDGILPNGEVVECKSHGITGPTDWTAWGKEGTDDIPDNYALQVQTQLLVTGAAVGHIAALIGGRGFCLYRMEANEDIHEMILSITERFWKRVQDREPPDDVPHIEILKRMDRVAGKAITIDDSLALQYMRACEDAKLANDAKEATYEALVASIGDAEIGQWAGGEFTYKPQTRKAYTVEAGTYRVLRAKRQKEAATA